MIYIKGFHYPTISTMPYGSRAFFSVSDLIITERKVFVAYDTLIFPMEEIPETERSHYFFIERTPSGQYVFNFGTYFDEHWVHLYSSDYDNLVKHPGFLTISSEYFKITKVSKKSLHDKRYIIEELEKERQKAVDNEEYEIAAKLSKKINRWKRSG